MRASEAVSLESTPLEAVPLEAQHPDWPFDGAGLAGEEGAHARAVTGDVSGVRSVAARASTARNTAHKPAKLRREEFSGHESVVPSAEDREIDRQLALLTAAERSKLYRYAAQELRRVPHFEPEEGSAALGHACRYVMRKLRAAGLTLNDIEDDCT
jgi:hypothetical protein